MSDKKHQKTITLTKLDDTSHYRLWRAATEATFDVYNVLNIVLGTEVKPTELSATDAEKHCSGCQKQGHDMVMIKAMIEAHQETENTDLRLNVDELSYFNYFIFSHSLYYERRFFSG